MDEEEDYEGGRVELINVLWSDIEHQFRLQIPEKKLLNQSLQLHFDFCQAIKPGSQELSPISLDDASEKWIPSIMLDAVVCFDTQKSLKKSRKLFNQHNALLTSILLIKESCGQHHPPSSNICLMGIAFPWDSFASFKVHLASIGGKTKFKADSLSSGICDYFRDENLPEMLLRVVHRVWYSEFIEMTSVAHHREQDSVAISLPNGDERPNSAGGVYDAPTDDFDSAWAILTNPAKHVNPTEMSALLSGLGITEAADLRLCDTSQIEAIAANLKPVPYRALMRALGMCLSPPKL